MAKLKSVREVNGTVGKSKITQPSPELLRDLLSLLEIANQLAHYVETTGDRDGRRVALRFQGDLVDVERTHKIKISK